MSEAPKFNFGVTPATSSSTGSSLFGTLNNATSGGSRFGGGNNNTGGTGFSFSGFGNPPATSKPEEKQGSLFGSATNGGPSGSGGSSSLLGQQGAGSPISAFKISDNQKADESKSTGNTPSLFSGGFGNNLQTPAKATAPTSSGTSQTSGLFGASTGGAPNSMFGNTSATPSGSITPAPATSAPTFSFGGPSTTPAGPPPSNAFGSATANSGGLFGNNSGQQGGDLFGQKQGQQAQSTSTGSAPSSQPTPTSNLFANTTGAGGGGLFGNKHVGTGPSSFQGFNKPSEAPNDTSTVLNTTAEAPKSFFNLGQTSSTSTTTASAPLLFGSQSTANQAAPSLFSVPSSTPSESGPPKPAFSFPGQNTATSNAPAPTPTSTAADTSSSKPLFELGAAKTSQPPSIGSTSSGGLFQFKPPTSSASGPRNSSTTPTSGQPASSLFQSPGSTSTSSTSQFTTTNVAAAPSTVAPAVTGPGTSTLGASTSGPVPPAQSRLRNKTMDEILTRWASDLTKYTKEFKAHAETVAKWDQVLVDNMSKISKLYTQTATSEKQTASVEMQLTAVENQQNELDSWLTKYEHEVDEMLAKNGPSQEVGGPDQERERTFKLAERLGERLEDMSRDLESMIEEVNAANTSLNKNSKADEPITQIVRILNSHLTQLQAIDQGTVALQEKVSKAQKIAQGLGHLNSGDTGTGNGAVEDFYRSYMGRK